MLIEYRLAGDREHRSVFRLESMSLSPVEPEPVLIVEEPDVAHPMPGPPLGVNHFCSRIRVDASNVTFRNDRSAHGDLADLAIRQGIDVFEFFDRFVSNGDNSPFDLRETSADADAAAFRRFAPCLAKDFRRTDRRDR